MDNTIQVALITAGISLVVSLFSMLSTLVVSRKNSKSSKELEKLKHNLQVHRRRLEEQRTLQKNYLLSLGNGIGTVQKVKDVLQIILTAYKDSHLPEVAIANIQQASSDLTKSYETYLNISSIYKDEDAEKFFHRAKGMAIETQNTLISTLKEVEYVSDLSVDHKTNLKDRRDDLSDIQDQLRQKYYECYHQNHEESMPE